MIVKEVTQEFSRSANDTGIADSAARVFRILRDNVSDYVDVQGQCKVYIGDSHPDNDGIYCKSFDVKYDGDSRMLLVCTFQYAATPSPSGDSGGGQDPMSVSPDTRPANWSMASAMMEVPVQSWKEVNSVNGIASATSKPAVNPVGDRYDGVTRFEPIITITIEQFFNGANPASPYLTKVGCVNSKEFEFVGLGKVAAGCMMFRSVQARPTVVPWNNKIYRGFMATFEFAYRRNAVKGVFTGGTYLDQDVGWDIAVPQTGFNVKAFVPPGSGDQDPYGQPLKHSNGAIVPALMLPSEVVAGNKVRAMVKVFEYANGGASQLPSAQPIALNNDGTPRIITADPAVIIKRWRVADEADFKTVFKDIRLT